MARLTTKVAIPITLVGIFTIIVFYAIGNGRLETSFFIVMLFLVIFVFFFGIAIGQSLSSPIKTILDQAMKLSSGNLSSRVYLESKDELSQLADAFNKIAEELKVSHEQQLNAEKSVGIKVKAQTRDLEETINALDQKVKNRTIELSRLVDESSKLQTDAKNKETEILQLKSELNNFKQKLGKYSKNQEVPKKETVNKNI